MGGLWYQLFYFPSNSLLMTLESSEGWFRAVGTSTYVDDPAEAPGSWVETGSALTIVTIWGVNKQIEALSLCLSFSINLFFQ